MRPTVSALYLGGLIKHVAATEASWVRFAEGGAEAMNRNWGPDAYSRHWHLQTGETLAGVLADYEAVAAHTDELVATIARPGRRPRAARGTLVRAERPLVGPPGVPAHHRRDLAARRARRHPAGVDRRSEDDGLTGGQRSSRTAATTASSAARL